MDLSVITYDSTSSQEKHIASIDELSSYENDSKISWINISGLKDTDSIKRLGKMYNLHDLSIEDILDTEQQPKVEIFEHYFYLSIKTIQREIKFIHNAKKMKMRFFSKKAKQSEEKNDFSIDQISMIIMKNIVITFQEMPSDTFNAIRKQISKSAGIIRKMGTDYLSYAIIDAVVNEYYHALNHLEEDIGDFEDQATKTNDEAFIEELQYTKKYLFKIRRAISPIKDNIMTITRNDRMFKNEELKPFLQDLNELINNALVIVENHHEWLSNIMEVNVSFLSFQLNKIMKTLTIISTIFIPLTFIVGIYGMNFEYMPELKYRFAYPIVLGIMGLIIIFMLILFKKRRWF